MRIHQPEPRRLILGSLLLITALLAGCSSSTRQLLDQAEANWRKGRYYEAIQANEELYQLERRGRHAPHALLNIGDIYYLNLRMLDHAIEYYTRLTQEFPNDKEALDARRKLAVIYANEVGDPSQAIAEYDKILETQNLDDRAEILYQRADAYFKGKDYYRALRELASLQETGIDAHLANQVSLKIGNIYQSQKKFVDAIEPFRKVLNAECKECKRRAVLNLTETYANLFEFDNAIATIQMLDKTPENEAYIRSEIQRLNEKRKRQVLGADLTWEYPRISESAAGAPKAPAAGKRGSQRRSPPAGK
jgi:tetratricopeptide (TPR) repeat protein